MLDKIEKQTKEKMAGAIEAMIHEFDTLRTGRASSALLDGVTVEAYGVPTPINQVASISVPDARTVMIQPWDKSIMAAIERAILAANLGFTPNNDGQVIRINIPALTEERRKELVKHAHQMGESGRIAVRNVRRHSNDELKKAQKNGDISENERDLQMEKIQKLTDERIKEIDELLKDKEKDILDI
jgi:ribosome recycling factor